MAWNHTLAYHPFVLRAVPPDCGSALEVGCGAGELSRKLADRCQHVTSIDVDAVGWEDERITLVHADAMTHPFVSDSFDLIVTVATLHHLPLRPALERFRRLLRPGGSLVAVGLYRAKTLGDYVVSAVAFPLSLAIRGALGEAEVGAAMNSPAETLGEIRAACESVMPAGRFERRLFFRYTFTWRKP